MPPLGVDPLFFLEARLNAAPDADTGPVTPSDHFGRRPVALIFGSYTQPPLA